MSQQQLVDDLKSSRESAKSALDKTYAKISKCKDNTKTASSLSYNAIHAICTAIKGGGSFLEIYSDAIVKLAATVSDHHWNNFVELLRFILGEFYMKNIYDQTTAIVALVKPERISTDADVKSYMKLYSRQLHYSHGHMNDDHIREIFQNVTALLVKCKEIQFEDLLAEFNAHLLGFPTMLQNVLVKHTDKTQAMFEKFFSAVGALKIPKKQMNDSYLLLTKHLVNLIVLDISDKNTVLSQNFLRACRDNQSIKEHKYQSYAINLMYYFVKLMLFPNALDFNRNLVEILGKFTTFLDRSELATEPWFMDTVVTMTRILDAYKGQAAIFQAMNEQSHFETLTLIEKLVKVAHGVSYESGLWTCCNSVRKHVIFKLCTVELAMFDAIVEQSFTKPELGTCVYTILKHSIAVAEFFKCNAVNYEVGLMMNALTRCTSNVKTKEHAEIVAKMVLLMTRAKAYLPENIVKSLAKCLMHVYKISGNSQGQAEAYALYITHLMETKADSDLIRKYIGAFYALEPCTSILETLDLSTFPLKPHSFSRRLLHSMEAGVFCKMRETNVVATTSLLKCSETILDFVLIARVCPQVNVSAKLDRKYAQLKEKSNRTPLENLALGHICKIRAVQQMEKLKNLFNAPKLNDDTLSKISDPAKLKLMDIPSEILIVNLAIEAIEYFEKFFDFAMHQPLPDADFFVDWEAIFDDISMLARLFHLRGYLDFAYISWHVLYRMSAHVYDFLNQIRALSFICDECLFVELYDPKFDFDAEIARVDPGILECLQSLDSLTPRRQNYVLVCLCYIGWYLAQKNRFEESQLLLDLALAKIDEQEERKNKFEYVRATYYAVNFRIQWKLRHGLSQRGAFCQVDRIMDEIRAVVYYTSEDSLNFPTLLFAVVNDLTEFTTNRLCEPATLPYIQMVLKLALDVGAAYRVVQFLVLWTHVNVQSENVAKCQMKLDLIDILFREKQPVDTTVKGNECVKVKNYLPSGPIEPYRIYGDEAVRKAAYVNPISPVRIKFEAPTIIRDLESFLITHDRRCTCDKCSHAFLKWQLFKVGCLNARLLYLGDVYAEPDQFYSKALNWCAKNIHESHTKFHFKEYEVCMLVQYINLLRRTRNFEAALSVSEVFADLYEKFKGAFDGVYLLNLSIQKESTIAAMNEKPVKIVLTARRTLTFSPPELQPEPKPVTTVRRGRVKKESPKTLKEDIENIIYKDTTPKPAVQKSARKREAKPERQPRRKEKIDDAVDQVCKAVEEVHLTEKESTPAVTSTRKRGRQNLNTAIIIIDDNEGTTPPAVTRRAIPKTASKVESTPKARGRTRKAPPATVAVVKTAEVDSRTKLLLRRRI